MQSIIFHIDMNSYFATVAQQENPKYRGKPLGVCEHLGGIIIAASIEAKKWGIKTGTPVWEAKKIYPKIILTKTLPDSYRKYIKAVVGIVSDYTDKVEQASIDELYADMTKATNIRCMNEDVRYDSNSKKILNPKSYILNSYVDPYNEAVKIALEIKRRIKNEVGDYLTCSIGIASNKLVAKIGSDMKKPDGIIVIKSDKLEVENKENENPKIQIQNFKQVLNPKDIDDVVSYGNECGLVNKPGSYKNLLVLYKSDLYSRLKLTDIPGIARRQEKNLNELGIKTLLDLKNFPVSVLVKKFGINGYHLHKMGQLEGSFKAKVHLEQQIKSIGHMYTLPKEYRVEKYFLPVLYKLCEMVAKRLRKQGLMGNVIHFFVRVTEHESFGESKKLSFYLYDGREIFLQTLEIYKKLTVNNKQNFLNYKLIGITVAGLKPQTNQLTLFGSEEKLKRVVGALDKINLKYGDFTITRTPLIYAKNVFQDSVGFGRVKEK